MVRSRNLKNFRLARILCFHLKIFWDDFFNDLDRKIGNMFLMLQIFNQFLMD